MRDEANAMSSRLASRDSGNSCERTSVARWLSNPLPDPMNAVIGSMIHQADVAEIAAGRFELVEVLAQQEQLVALVAAYRLRRFRSCSDRRQQPRTGGGNPRHDPRR